MRRFFFPLLDVLLILIAYSAAYLLKFDFSFSIIDYELFQHGLIIMLLCKPIAFVAIGMYRNMWRYASMQDVILILKAVTLSSFVTFVALLFIREGEYFPRTVLILDWLMLLCLVAASRGIWRLLREHHIINHVAKGPRTLIIGAGEAGSILLREIRKQQAITYNVAGFIDDDPKKLGMKLHGVSVLGDTCQLIAIIGKHRIDEVIIAMPSASKADIRNILDRCQKAHVRFKILPSISTLIDGTVSVSSIKEVDIEDLLGRDPIRLDEKAIQDYLSDKKVLVSGAGGSIGSEICRQVAKFKPRKLVLVEAGETPLYEIELELTSAYPDLPIVPIIADIRNKDRIESVFEEFLPDVVFHAAAYKHVPMMEYNPSEAICNNCGGTKVLADISHAFGVRNFVMISTDKAVNPTNVMGASKRIAEIYVQSLSTVSKTRFTTVRFGNVLGSNGSVIPLFKEQIKKGGPITVTDKRIIRYFMTIPEASQLVLQASSLGKGGEIFVLDMGEPVRIVDLAEELIRLSGLIPYEDIDIVFTGLRPGEKLFEELLIDGEGIKETSHDKIRVLGAVYLDRLQVLEEMDKLLSAAALHDLPSLMTCIRKMVPEFKPNYTFGNSPPVPFRRLRPDLYPHTKSNSKIVNIKPLQ